MKSNKKNIRAALRVCAFSLLSLCASCDRNDVETEPKNEGPETAYLEIDNIGVEGNVLSRVTAVPTTGEIGFYRATTNSYAAVNNNKGVWKMSAVTSKNAWIPAPIIKVGTADATMAVYYPYVSTNTTTLVLPAGELGAIVSGKKVQETWSKRFTYNSMSSYNQTVSQELKHVYAKLQVKLSRGTGFIGAPDWTKIQLAGTGMCTTGNFNPLNNDAPTLTDYTRTSGTLTVTLATLINFSGSTSTAADLLLIPNTLSGNLTVTITLGGKEMSVPVNTSAPAGFNGQLLPGKQYNLTITVNATDLEIASLTTADWSTVSLPGETTH